MAFDLNISRWGNDVYGGTVTDHRISAECNTMPVRASQGRPPVQDGWFFLQSVEPGSSKPLEF